MKKQFFKSLILGVCCSVMIVGGSCFADVCNQDDVYSNFEKISITSTILELTPENENHPIESRTIEAMAYLGDNFGEDSGYYVLDVAKSFTEDDNVTGKYFVFNQVGFEEELLIYFSFETGGGVCYINLSQTLLADPSNVRKVNEDGKDYLVLEDNGRELYWQKTTLEDIHNGNI